MRIDPPACHGHFLASGTGPAAQIRHEGQKIACLGSRAGVIRGTSADKTSGEIACEETASHELEMKQESQLEREVAGEAEQIQEEPQQVGIGQ